MKYTRIVYDNKFHNFAIIPNTAQNSIDISSTINDKIISPLFTFCKADKQFMIYLKILQYKMAAKKGH